MNIVELKNIVAQRLAINNNDDFTLMECWKKEVAILSENTSETIAFFDTCTDEEFFWLSEVFDDLIEKTKSKELFQAICDRTERISNPEYKASIATDIEFARGQLED